MLKLISGNVKISNRFHNKKNALMVVKLKREKYIFCIESRLFYKILNETLKKYDGSLMSVSEKSMVGRCFSISSEW